MKAIFNRTAQASIPVTSAIAQRPVVPERGMVSPLPALSLPARADLQ